MSAAETRRALASAGGFFVASTSCGKRRRKKNRSADLLNSCLDLDLDSKNKMQEIKRIKYFHLIILHLALR